MKRAGFYTEDFKKGLLKNIFENQLNILEKHCLKTVEFF